MYPPPVPFRKPEKTLKPINKDEYKTVTLKIDPSDEAKDSPTIDKKVRLFAVGTAEDWLRWRMEWEDVVCDKPLKTGTQRMTMALTLLKGRAKELFQEALKFRQSEGPTSTSDTTVFTQALNDTGRHVFPPERAYQRQHDYMLRYLKLDGSQTVREFTARLRKLNSYLPYFPVKTGTTPVPFTEDELSSILNHTKPARWQVAMLTTNIDVYEMSWDQLVEYFERLELSQSLETRERKNKRKHSPEHHHQHHDKKQEQEERKDVFSVQEEGTHRKRLLVEPRKC